MALDNALHAFEILLPVLFVVALGFWAGRAKRFDSDQVAGLNDLVLTFAFPALLFVAIVRASRATLFSELHFVLAMIVATFGLFIVIALLSMFALRHTAGAAALQATSATYSNASFAGIPILTPLFGTTSLFSIAIAALILNVTIVPVAVTMLEYDRRRAAGGTMPSLGTLVGRSVLATFEKPYVWAPLLGAVLVLLDVRVPQEIQNMLDLIASATSGVALFVAGLILAAYRVKLSLEILGNVSIKMLVQPVVMALLVTALAIAKPVGSEAILICAVSTAVMCPMLAVRYKVYEAEAASTFLLTTLSMIVIIPLAITLTR
ncbi:MAG TPA: AEC family transporter [Candidatus Acidoferrum sp.]|nr:AEC family transporter [Candidatus Acidoferrum sp.]